MPILQFLLMLSSILVIASVVLYAIIYLVPLRRPSTSGAVLRNGVWLHYGLVFTYYFTVFLHQGASHVVQELLSASLGSYDVPRFEHSLLPVQTAQGCRYACGLLPHSNLYGFILL